MHMNSVPQHLHSEDRQEYERILDEALRSAPHHPELAAVGQRLNPEQLRTMALNASALITASAATEYQHYVKARDELRHPAPSTPSPAGHESGTGEPGVSGMGLAATMGEAAEAVGAGAVAVAAVLTPVLAGTAAVIFLLVGYILRMLDPEAGVRQDDAHHRMDVRSRGRGRDPGRHRRPSAHRPAQPPFPGGRPVRRTERGGGPRKGSLAGSPAGAGHPALPARGARRPRHECRTRHRPHPMRHPPAACRRSDTAVRVSAAPTKETRPVPAPATAARTTPARTSAGRNTSRNRPPACAPAPGSAGRRPRRLERGYGHQPAMPVRGCPPAPRP